MNIEQLSKDFSEANFNGFLHQLSDSYKPVAGDLSYLLEDLKDDTFETFTQHGEIEYDDITKVVFCCVRLSKELTSQTSKKKQGDLAKKALKELGSDAGIFAFYDRQKQFRLSFVRFFYGDKKREVSTHKRYSFFVSPKRANKTVIQQFKKGKALFSSIEGIQKVFSIEEVSDAFYNEFQPKYEKLAGAVKGHDDVSKRHDFALLFVIRTIFLGFVQKKGWLGEDENFLEGYWQEYDKSGAKDKFYDEWLQPLFFEALNSKPGQKVKYQNNPFSKKTEAALQMAPYLNGELFKRHPTVDTHGAYIPDAEVQGFLEFLFQYNFTIEENTNIDEELELNPEFLGIIFERLVNKENGAVYTPRTEVDLMCRLSLVKWLEKKTSCRKQDLFELFFREGGQGKEFDAAQRDGSFSEDEIRQLLANLESVTVCDPAAGSGAFEVGMMQVLNEVIANLRDRPRTPPELRQTSTDEKELQRYSFERKKKIIANSLYGVEVKQWAVWINQLRLWLSLFIDMPDDEKDSQEPLLPSLNFKVRVGDSLVQRLGDKIFPIHGHPNLSPSLRRQVTNLRKKKTAFYNNQGVTKDAVEAEERRVFEAILNAEIEDRRVAHKKLAGYKPSEQISWLEETAKQLNIDVDAVEKDNLAQQITQLEKELGDIRTQRNRPFIWSIEFAEVFYDKGGFDIVIGNPPYIRQEDIADPLGFVPQAKDYKALLEETIRADYPDYFTKKRKINGRSDLYVYFYLHTLHLLNKDGFHCFICSNSWLDVGFGVWMQEFLLNKVRMHYVIDNHTKRSFKNADVNTVITLFEAPQKKNTWQAEPVRFLAFKRPFEETIITENLQAIDNVKVTTINPSYRIYVPSHEELENEGLDTNEGNDLRAAYIGEKWGGKYLRAPDVFATIIKKGEGLFLNLKKITNVRFGVKTGCNDFFYLTRDEANYWKIEEEFLKPVIKSPRECKSIQIDHNDLKHLVFLCNKPKNELSGTYALKYIEYGEDMEVEIGQGEKKGDVVNGVQNLKSVKGRKLWYSLGEVTGTSFWVKETNKTLAVYFSEGPMIADCRLYYADIPKNYRYQLNSTVNLLIDEALSRAGLGLGARSKMVYEVNNQMALLIPELQFSGLDLCRPVEDIFKECGINPESATPIEEQEPKPLPDRKALDDVIFDALELSTEERKDVYRAVCRLVWNRISKAKNK